MRSITAFLIVLCLVIAGMVAPTVAAPGGVFAAPDADTVTIPPGSPVEIAAQTTTALATFQDHIDAVQMALDDYGPIKGFSLQRNDYNDDCTEPGGQTTANTIVANAANVGVIGPICSSAAYGAAPVFNTNDVVMISPTNTNPDVYTSGPRVYNRTVIVDPMFDSWDVVNARLPSVQTWEAQFNTLYGRAPDNLAKYVYDATTLLLTRIDQVSSLDGGGNLVLSRIALAAAVRNTSNFQGVTGAISLDVNGNRLHSPDTMVEYDPFSQAVLDPVWSWWGVEPTQWSLTALPGFLQIYTQDDQPNRLLRRAPAWDFEIRTYVQFTPAENFQFGGLFLYGDDDNFMAFGRAYCDPGIPVCVGNGIYFDYVDEVGTVASNYATTTTWLTDAYLRVVAQGNNYTGYVSENGVEWIEIGTHTATFTPQKVGVIASNARQPVAEIPANFDFFVLQYEAEQTSLPVVMR